MKHRIAGMLALLSLVLCALTLWHWGWNLVGESTRIGTIRGGFAVASIDASDEFVTTQLDPTAKQVVRFLYGIANTTQRDALGFTYGFGQVYGAAYSFVVVPYWFAALVTAILPLRWWLLRYRRRQRIVTGRCLACGYDLRGSPERCPECGAAAGTAPAATTGVAVS